jgi:hypothetical protein
VSIWIDHQQSSLRLWSLTLIGVCLTPTLIWLVQRRSLRRRQPKPMPAAQPVSPERVYLDLEVA